VKEVSAGGEHEILTTCPSCVAGLSKQWNGRQVTGKSLIVRVAEEQIGSGWERDALRMLKKGAVAKIPF
jgi:Fe-S oxidoreductase